MNYFHTIFLHILMPFSTTFLYSCHILSHIILCYLISLKAYNPQTALIEAHKICKSMLIQHPTIQVQDAAAGNSQLCLSEMCVADRTCVVPTPSSYLTSGF